MDFEKNPIIVKASVMQVYLVLILLSLTSSTTLTTSSTIISKPNFADEHEHVHHTPATNSVPVSFRHNPPPEVFRGKSEFPQIEHAFL